MLKKNLSGRLPQTSDATLQKARQSRSVRLEANSASGFMAQHQREGQS